MKIFQGEESTSNRGLQADGHHIPQGRHMLVSDIVILIVRYGYNSHTVTRYGHNHPVYSLITWDLGMVLFRGNTKTVSGTAVFRIGWSKQSLEF